MQQQADAGATTPQIQDGMTVYSADGAKLGTVRNYQPTARYLEVHQGMVLAKDFYFPLAAVESAVPELKLLTLRLEREQIEQGNYETPPAAVEDAPDWPRLVPAAPAVGLDDEPEATEAPRTV